MKKLTIMVQEFLQSENTEETVVSRFNYEDDTIGFLFERDSSKGKLEIFYKTGRDKGRKDGVLKREYAFNLKPDFVIENGQREKLFELIKKEFRAGLTKENKIG